MAPAPRHEPEPEPEIPPEPTPPPLAPESVDDLEDLEEVEEDWIEEALEILPAEPEPAPPPLAAETAPEPEPQPEPEPIPEPAPAILEPAPPPPQAAEPSDTDMAAALDAAMDAAAALGVPASSHPPQAAASEPAPAPDAAQLPAPHLPPGAPEPGQESPPEPLTFESTLRLGDELRKAGSPLAAIEEYKRSLFLLGNQQTPERAEVYVRLGQVFIELDRETEALSNFEKALRIDPLHKVALRGAVELFVQNGQFERVDKLQQRRLQALTEPEARRQVFHQRVDLWLDEAKAPERAEQILRELLAEQPEDGEALRRLVDTLHALGRHEDAVQARTELADLFLSIPTRRARLLVEAAHAVREHLEDTEAAIELCYQALTADPSALDALEIASEMLVQSQDWERLADIYEAMLDQWEDDRVALDLAKKLGFLARDILIDTERAARAFELALALDENDASLRFALAELYESLEDYEQAVRHCRAAVASEPTNVQGYHRAYSLFRKTRQEDTAWNAAVVLDHLGEADINESLLADTYRPDGLLAVQKTVEESDWSNGLFYPERDPAISAVLEAVCPAAIAARIDELEQQSRLPKLEEKYRTDPEQTTTTLARTLSWTARLLRVQAPTLYVYPQVKGGLSAAAVAEPSALAGRDLGSGLSANELAFLWGRHLTFFRPEHYLLVFYPTVKDLASVLLATLYIGEGPGKSTGQMARRTQQRAALIRSHLDEPALEKLRKATRKFPMENASAQMLAWARTVELAAGRAGLLACGDLSAAAELTGRYPIGGQLSIEERVADLMSFVISEEYETLRVKLGVAIQP